jgi:hypothetical protein
VNAADDLRAGQRLLVGVAVAKRHERRHLGLGEVDLAPAEIGQAHVGHFVVSHLLFPFRCVV